jgi:hypothetical protein
LLNEVKTVIPEAIQDPDRHFSLTFPADMRITNLLRHIHHIQDDLNLQSYTLHLDSLEHTLLKITNDEEAQIQDS